MANTIKIKRGTRAQLNAAASANGLQMGEPYLITDEGRLAVGLTVSTYGEYALTEHDHPADTIYHGVESIGALSFDNGTHVLTVATAVNKYWFQGIAYTTSNAITCDLDSYVTLTTNTLYFAFFDAADGVLKASATPWGLKTHVPVATVFWNGSAGARLRRAQSHPGSGLARLGAPDGGGALRWGPVPGRSDHG